MRLFKFAREHAEQLIVCILEGGEHSPAAHVPADLRLEGVQANSLVDQAFITNEPVEEIIARLKPEIVIKGKEHELAFNAEEEIVNGYGGKLLFSSGEALFSSLDLIKKELWTREYRAIDIPREFIQRHNITKHNLFSLIDAFKGLRVCVIGDSIIDEYVMCEPLGMSQEDPTIVVAPITNTRFIGGAAIVAAHAASLGAEVSFLSVIGDDEPGRYLESEMVKNKINSILMVDECRPTTLKRRYRSHGKTLLRVSYLQQSATSRDLQSAMLERLGEIIDDIDLLVFSDFNYGCLPNDFVDNIISISRNKDIFLVADSQSSSQIGDISRFKSMDLLTPTEREVRISLRNKEAGLVVLAEELGRGSEAKNIFLKLGEEGMLIHAKNKIDGAWITDRVDALNQSPKDTAGAGDSLLIVSSMALTIGSSVWEAAYLGSLVAAIQVGRLGNIPILATEVKELIAKQLNNGEINGIK